MSETNQLPYAPTGVGGTAGQRDLTVLAAVERQIKFAAIFTAAFGVFFAVASTNATDVAVRWLGDLMFWRVGESSGHLSDINHLADAILGGVMAGWGAMMWMLADRLLAREPDQVKSILMVSLLVWFPIDTAASIASGGWLNAISNLAFLAMFWLPLRRI